MAAILYQLAVSLLVTSSVFGQHDDTPRSFYDNRRGNDQGGMQYYYIPQNMPFNGRQQEMTYAQDPFFGYNGESPIPFSQDIFKPVPARRPQSTNNDRVNPGPYSEHTAPLESDQAPYYIIPAEVELPEKALPIVVSPTPSTENTDSSSPEPVESSSNSTQAPTVQPEEGNSTNVEGHEAPVNTSSPVASDGLNFRKSPQKIRPYFTNAHHFPFPMGMKNEYKLQYQAMFPDAPMPEQENFGPSNNFGNFPVRPNEFMWNPYNKKPGQQGFVDYDPSMLLNAQVQQQLQQQQQQKPQLIYYFFNPQGNGMPQSQSAIPDIKSDQPQLPSFNNQPSSPVYMLFQPSEEESFNGGPQPDQPVQQVSTSISGRGGQNGQYVEVPVSFMSNQSPQQNRFYYVRPDLNRYVNDRV